MTQSETHFKTPAARRLGLALTEEAELNARLNSLRGQITVLREIVAEETDSEKNNPSGRSLSFKTKVAPDSPDLTFDDTPPPMPQSLTEACLWVINNYATISGITTGQVRAYLTKHGYEHTGGHFSSSLQKTMQRLVTSRRIFGGKREGQWIFSTHLASL